MFTSTIYMVLFREFGGEAFEFMSPCVVKQLNGCSTNHRQLSTISLVDSLKSEKSLTLEEKTTEHMRLTQVFHHGFHPTCDPWKDKWPYWASPLFTFLTDRVHKAIVRFLNRPGIQELRRIDEKFYTVTWLPKRMHQKKRGELRDNAIFQAV